MRILLTYLACFGLALSADAQPALDSAPVNRRGLHIGIDPGTYATLTSDGITGGRSVGGFGLSLRFGWGFTDRLALTMDVGVTDLIVADTAGYLLGNGDLLLRYSLGAFTLPLGTIVPFVHGGVGLRDITAEDASPTNTKIYVFEGEALTLGGGASIYFSRELALFAALYWNSGDFNDERVGNVTTHSRGVSGVSTRVSIGLTWHRGRGRAAP